MHECAELYVGLQSDRGRSGFSGRATVARGVRQQYLRRRLRRDSGRRRALGGDVQRLAHCPLSTARVNPPTGITRRCSVRVPAIICNLHRIPGTRQPGHITALRLYACGARVVECEFRRRLRRDSPEWIRIESECASAAAAVCYIGIQQHGFGHEPVAARVDQRTSAARRRFVAVAGSTTASAHAILCDQIQKRCICAFLRYQRATQAQRDGLRANAGFPMRF